MWQLVADTTGLDPVTVKTFLAPARRSRASANRPAPPRSPAPCC
ncbi:hypothetical protein ABH935_008243 [Catenulispora sp. GAS73]